MAIDPVCKMEVEESKAAATSDYMGKKYANTRLIGFFNRQGRSANLNPAKTKNNPTQKVSICHL